MCSSFPPLCVLYPISRGKAGERGSVTYVISPRTDEMNLAGADGKLNPLKS